MTTNQALTARVTEWSEPLSGKSPDEMTKYFDTIHDDFVSLREHISNYQYAIPTVMFSKYQQALSHFNDLLQEQRDTAIPKKKFAFARKAKKPKTEVKKAAEETKAEEIKQSDFTGNHL